MDPYGYGIVAVVLRAVARRCLIHHRASVCKTRELEDALGIPRSELLSPREPYDSHANYDLIDCGQPWCMEPRRGRWRELALAERLAGPADYAD